MTYRTERGLPRWTDGRGAGGTWKEAPEEFVVEEIPLAAPTGSGEHQWFRVEKVGRTTLEVVDALVHAAGVTATEVGYAGLKDRFARTVQEFTVLGGREIGELPPGMRILDRSRTARRLRVGQLAGNAFAVRVRGGDPKLAEERLGRLRRTNMPNYYGVQRVGGDAPALGRSLVLGAGPRLPHARLKFALSAYQAELFNRVLRSRGNARLDGDLCEDRIPTGPIYGATMRWPADEACALEESVLYAEDLPPDAWRRFGPLTLGTRRRLWIPVDGRVERAEHGFWLRFRLPAGSYATVLLEEIL